MTIYNNEQSLTIHTICTVYRYRCNVLIAGHSFLLLFPSPSKTPAAAVNTHASEAPRPQQHGQVQPVWGVDSATSVIIQSCRGRGTPRGIPRQSNYLGDHNTYQRRPCKQDMCNGFSSQDHRLLASGV